MLLVELPASLLPPSAVGTACELLAAGSLLIQTATPLLDSSPACLWGTRSGAAGLRGMQSLKADPLLLPDCLPVTGPWTRDTGSIMLDL
jgi:hypothetical protein